MSFNQNNTTLSVFGEKKNENIFFTNGGKPQRSTHTESKN